MECHASCLKAALKNGRSIIITMKFMSPHLRRNLFAPVSVGIKPALLSIMHVINYREDIKSTRTSSSSERANLFPAHRQNALDQDNRCSHPVDIVQTEAEAVGQL